MGRTVVIDELGANVPGGKCGQRERVSIRHLAAMYLSLEDSGISAKEV